MAVHQAPPSLGFSRKECWSGLPLPSPMHESGKWKWSCSVVSDSLRPQTLQPTRFLCPWEFSDKSTGMSCHCLLQVILLLTWKFCNGSPISLIIKAMHLKWLTRPYTSYPPWLYPSNPQQIPNASLLSIFSYFNFLPATLPSLLFLNNASDTLHWLLALLGKFISQISLG